jgi:hypothetical protein
MTASKHRGLIPEEEKADVSGDFSVTACPENLEELLPLLELDIFNLY